MDFLFSSVQLHYAINQNVQKLNNSMNSGYGGIGWSQKENDSVHTGLEISDLFADLDCSSKDAFMADFNAKLSDMRTLVQQFGKNTTFLTPIGVSLETRQTSSSICNP